MITTFATFVSHISESLELVQQELKLVGLWYLKIASEDTSTSSRERLKNFPKKKEGLFH
jgi:hypothetical protein